MCSALELCKKHGIVHRDVKPQNIFVSPNGDYKLGDFGIAKTVEKTIGGTKIGTYKYMAPEVYNNQPYGTAADIYSLGLVLYWMLNERRMPFLPLPPEKLKAGMDESARNRRLSGEQLPPPAYGSENLKKIVLKACSFVPEDRYTTAEEMLDDLNQLGDQVEGDEEYEEKRAQEELRRKELEVAHKKEAQAAASKKKLITACAAVVAVAVLVGIFALGGKDDSRASTQNSTSAGTGWQNIDGATYYFGDDGKARTYWQNINGATYYFGEDGKARIGWQEIDGVSYNFGDNGVLVG